jgi:hypothetical protein
MTAGAAVQQNNLLEKRDPVVGLFAGKNGRCARGLRRYFAS